MKQGFIDSASVHDVMWALAAEPDEWTEWMRRAAFGVTLALWSNSQFAIAPDPVFDAEAHKVFKRLLLALSPVVSGIACGQREMIRDTARWARRSSSRIRAEYDRLQADLNFRVWLDRSISYWPQHQLMHHDLFNVSSQ